MYVYVLSIYLEIGAAQLRSVTEIVPRSPSLCVNRNLIHYRQFQSCQQRVIHNLKLPMRSFGPHRWKLASYIARLTRIVSELQ